MPKPTDKAQLLAAAHKEYAALDVFLATLSPTQMTTPGALGDWSVKDVLAHLLEWHNMVLSWYAAGLRGETPPVPAQGYKWSDLPALNERIRTQYAPAPLGDILTGFRASHARLIQHITDLDEADLFTPGRYPWMRANTLAAYFNSSAGSHYRWARTEMQKTRNQAAKA